MSSITNVGTARTITDPGFVASLSPIQQIEYAISELHNHLDENVLEWDIGTRQNLLQGGYACLFLVESPTDNASTAPFAHEPHSLSTTGSVKPIVTQSVTANHLEIMSDTRNADTTGPIANTFNSLNPAPVQSKFLVSKAEYEQHNPSCTYTYCSAPKLALVATSPIFRSFFLQNPSATEIVLTTPSTCAPTAIFTPSALHTLALWLTQLLRSPSPRSIDCRADRKSLFSIRAALSLRIAMQLLGMDATYLTHFVPFYTASLSQRVPSTLEAGSVVEHVLGSVEEDAVVKVLAERLVELARIKKFKNVGLWEAFLAKDGNHGLLVAMQAMKWLMGVETVAVRKPGVGQKYLAEKTEDGLKEEIERLEKKASGSFGKVVRNKVLLPVREEPEEESDAGDTATPSISVQKRGVKSWRVSTIEKFKRIVSK